MTIGQAREIALGHKNAKLGAPTKMPGYAFGISAFKCRRGEELAQDPRTPCAHCYARANFYRTKHEVLIAHERRMAGLTHPEWIPAMAVLILHSAEPEPETTYFRWHDSGDLQGVWHLANIVEVCRRTPKVRHWLPTHEPFIVLEYLEQVKSGAAPAVPENLCIRISADKIGEAPAAILGLEHLPTSTTHRGHGNDRAVQVSDRRGDSIECKSYRKTKVSYGAGLCGSCRACWESRVKNISYPMHGEQPKRRQLPMFPR